MSMLKKIIYNIVNKIITLNKYNVTTSNIKESYMYYLLKISDKYDLQIYKIIVEKNARFFSEDTNKIVTTIKGYGIDNEGNEAFTSMLYSNSYKSKILVDKDDIKYQVLDINKFTTKLFNFLK